MQDNAKEQTNKESLRFLLSHIIPVAFKIKILHEKPLYKTLN